MANGTTTPGSQPGRDAASVRHELVRLGAAGATGRLGIRGVAGGWIHLQDGHIYCAERVGRPTLLVAMGEARLFSQEQWTMALRLPFGPKWAALGATDPAKRGELTAFTREYVLENVGALLDEAHDHVRTPSVFVAGVAHPFGPLERWPVEEILAELPPPAPRAHVPSVDRAEFLELLEEVSPHLERRGDGRLSFTTEKDPR